MNISCKINSFDTHSNGVSERKALEVAGNRSADTGVSSVSVPWSIND